MSILCKNDRGSFISHENYINNTYKCKTQSSVYVNPKLFHIFDTYCTNKNSKKRRNTKCELNTFTSLQLEVEKVKVKYSELYDEIKINFETNKCNSCIRTQNKEALLAADYVYAESGKHAVDNLFGSNYGPAIIKSIQNTKFLFPENCIFYSKDVNEIELHLKDTYDLILLDPPWWNKYIRRKRKKCTDTYTMMYNKNLKNIPIEKLLKDDGMVVVWCTNSQQHLTTLTQEIFPKWGLKFVAKWFWLKVTRHGEPVCNFSVPPGKQPFEQIIFGCKEDTQTLYPKSDKIIVSVPSAIHSHKPPLTELLQEFLPDNPKCLEIFARYLLPNWTSYGNEVLRFQHESLFQIQDVNN